MQARLLSPTLPPPNVDLPLGAEASSTVRTTYGPRAPGLPAGPQAIAGPVTRVPTVRHVGQRRVALGLVRRARPCTTGTAALP